LRPRLTTGLPVRSACATTHKVVYAPQSRSTNASPWPKEENGPKDVSRLYPGLHACGRVGDYHFPEDQPSCPSGGQIQAIWQMRWCLMLLQDTPGKNMRRQLKGQLHSSAGRSSKAIKDHERIEAVVEVPGVGSLVLHVDRGGGYSLRGYPEGAEDSSRNLLAVGVMRSDGIVAVSPEEASAVERERD
jgi:hypothetical protein